MKKVLAALAAVAALVSIYAVYAWYSVRGLRVYTIHSSLGAVFANSWWICAAAAGVLWLLFVIILACSGKRKKEKSIRPPKTRKKVKGQEGLIEPKRAGTVPNPGAAVPNEFSEMQKTADQGMPGFQAPFQPDPQEQDEGTEFAGESTEFYGGGGQTGQEQTPLFPEDADSETEFMDSLDVSNSWMGEQSKKEEAPLYCGHCGALLAKGQKFCMKCGTKVGGV